MKTQPLWRVLGAYLAGGWLVLEVVDQLGQNGLLPPWGYKAALGALLVGLALVVLTSVVQHGVGAGLEKPGGRLSRLFTWRRAGLVALVLFAAWGVASTVWVVEAKRRARFMNEAIDRIEGFVEQGDWEQANAVAREAARMSPHDPRLASLWEKFSWLRTIDSHPSGARVFRREYSDSGGEWELLGTTPLKEIHFPFGYSLLRFELDGYRTLAVAAGVTVEAGTNLEEWNWFTLDPASGADSTTVRVPGWEESILDTATALGDFRIDRFEVTNRQFKEFVHAGGYERPELWEHPFEFGDTTMSWAEAMSLFVDRTGRPGPSTWVAGDYPAGEDDFPVAGVSWFEAAAYARFVGKDLPTVYHWARAFDRSSAAWMLPQSNLDGSGAAPVGHFADMSPFGAFDMAGNVREWCWNATGSRRFFRGGGWNDPLWVSLQETQAQTPFDRTETNGFRLAEYRDTTHLARAREPLPEPVEPDYVNWVPVSDREFEIYRRQFSYDATPLRARIESVDTTRDWVRERISFDAAYGSERVVLYLYLPVGGQPPFQTVVYFPGGEAQLLASVDDYRTIQFDFLVKSGRALAFPVYKGTFQRPADSYAGVNARRDRVVQRVKDLRRTVDYLQTREDLAPDKLAYFGYSFGGSSAPYNLANEDRFSAAVLYVGGFNPGAARLTDEMAPSNYVPRVTVPVLMLNGRTDQNRQPIEQKVNAFFDWLGTAADRKKLVIEDGGHFVPRPVLIRETLDWLDRFLGKVGQ